MTAPNTSVRASPDTSVRASPDDVVGPLATTVAVEKLVAMFLSGKQLSPEDMDRLQFRYLFRVQKRDKALFHGPQVNFIRTILVEYKEKEFLKTFDYFFNTDDSRGALMPVPTQTYLETAGLAGDWKLLGLPTTS